MIQGGGYLYIQIGSGSGAKLYGPYTVGENNTATITDLPAGSHPFFAVLYASAIQTALAPVTGAGTELTESAYRSGLASLLASDTAASCKLLSNVEIAANKNTALSCTLIPLASDSLDCGYGAAGAALDFSGDGHRFVILSNFESMPAAVERQEIKLSLTNTSALSITVQNVALYNADGSLASSAPSVGPGTIAAGSSAAYLGSICLYRRSAHAVRAVHGLGLARLDRCEMED